MDKQKIIIGVVAGFFLALVLYLFQFGGWEQVRKLVESSASIEIRSASRPFAKVIVANEKLRFSLMNVNVHRVIWVIDDIDIIHGKKEIDYSIPFDSTSPIGSILSHRIDAFYRVGNSYETITKAISIENSNLAQFDFIWNSDSHSIILTDTTKPELISASLVNFDEGELTIYYPFNISSIENTIVLSSKDSSSQQLVTLISSQKDPPWIEYEIHDTVKQAIILALSKLKE